MAKNAKRKEPARRNLLVQHTAAGRDRSAQNARTHGALSSMIPLHERAQFEPWAAQIRAALAPEGAVEQMLAEQVIRLGWRQQRVGSWEGAAVEHAHLATVSSVFDGAEGVQHAEPHTLTTAQVVADLAARVKSRAADVLGEGGLTLVMGVVDERKREAADWTRLADADWTVADVLDEYLPERVAQAQDVLLAAWPDERASGRALAGAVWNVARPTRAQIDAVESLSGEYPSDLATARRVLALTATHNAEAARAALREEATRAASVAKRLRALWERVQAELERVAALPAVPPEATLANIQRYEAHLSRQFYRALHELEALQARRRGQDTPLSRVDVNGVDRDE